MMDEDIMSKEPLQANAYRVISFQADDRGGLDKQVNGWMQKQSNDVFVENMMLGHAMAVWEGDASFSFTMTIVYRDMAKYP